MKYARFIKKCVFLSALVCFSLLMLPSHVRAASFGDTPAITIINPIRGNELGLSNIDLVTSLKGQWKVTKDAGIPATWLWQYSALENTTLTTFAKNAMRGQEFGIFLEIDKNFAKEAGVQYRGQGPWYFSDGLFLSSYDGAERRKLIDKVFGKFHDVFGYYPKTVGAWWIGADALDYMQSTYGITGALQAADQYNLDVYTIWGAPWSIPYIPSTTNAAIPASSWNKSTKVVMMQWAARDPLQGYGNDGAFSTYSLQDFPLKGYDFSYFQYLGKIFLKPQGQIVAGLENGWSPQSYELWYKSMLQAAVDLENNHSAKIVQAKEYTANFLQRHAVFGATTYFLSKDFKTDNQSFWITTSNYRVGIQKIGQHIYVVDVRDYSKKTPEEFLTLPNSQGFLRIETPAVIDSATLPSQKLIIGESSFPLVVKKSAGNIGLSAGKEMIALFSSTTVTFPHSSMSFTFITPSFQIPLFWILVGIWSIESIIIFSKTKKRKIFIVAALGTVLVFLASYPFVVNNMSYLFDKKEFIFFPLLSFPYFSISARIILFCELLPFLILFFFEYLYFMYQRRIYEVIYFLYLVFLLVLFSHVPYFPLEKSLIKDIGIALLSSGIFLLVGTALILMLRKAKPITYSSLIAIPILLAVVFGVLFFSRSSFILTPFEIQALTAAAQEKKHIVYLLPTVPPIYKAVRPALYEDYHLGESLTHSHWTTLARNYDGSLTIPKEKNELILVPRYVGADLSNEEIQKYSLKKIFGNLQIALFSF